MSGNEFAEKCRGVATALNALADQAKGAEESEPEWAPRMKAETMGMLIDLAADFNRMKELSSDSGVTK